MTTLSSMWNEKPKEGLGKIKLWLASRLSHLVMGSGLECLPEGRRQVWRLGGDVPGMSPTSTA